MHFSNFFQQQLFAPWQDSFRTSIEQRTDPKRHGDLAAWSDIVSLLPSARPSQILLDQDTVTIGHPDDLSADDAKKIHDSLFALSPWRKGPFQLFDTFIDTEWRSDWKWQRVQPHLSSLSGRTVLDVGCGTGYHCWRMLGDGAKYVLGIDPSMRFLIQHKAIQKYANSPHFDLLPIGIEDMPKNMPLFDSVFSMGVLYHRRNPINHLLELKGLLADDGELVLETLIMDDIAGGIFTPRARYAQMRNVWSIMTVEKIIALLHEAGFKNIRCADQNVTSLDEQRRTNWMQFHSLNEFLDPVDKSKTIEGYPAPKRGLFLATK